MADQTNKLNSTPQTGFTEADTAALANNGGGTDEGVKVQTATVKQNGLEATTSFIKSTDGEVVYNGPSPGKLASDLSRMDVASRQNQLGELNRNLATQVNTEAQVKQAKEDLMNRVTVQSLENLANGGGSKIASESAESGSTNGTGETGAGVGETTASTSAPAIVSGDAPETTVSYTLATGQTKPVDEMTRAELDEAAKALNVDGYEFVKNKTEAAEKVKAAIQAKPAA